MSVSILILSDKNETRGPMLEGWIKYYAKVDAKVHSAGLETGKLNLIAAKAMMEAVIDITRHQSQAVNQINTNDFNFVISLTKPAAEYAKINFSGAHHISFFTEHPLNEQDEDMEKLRKHRQTANELEEFAIGFVHQNVRTIM
ncbi:MAG: hypothetical protein R6U85_02520 [Salinivirgaceae bacterium]